MIIDAHVHIGTIIDFNMTEKMVLESMDKYHIDYSLVSNIAGCEVDHDQVPIPMDEQFSQKEINERAIRFAKENPDKIGVLLWAKPVTESADEEFEAMLCEHRNVIYGIKIHPYHSRLSFESPQVQAYIRLAQKYDLTVVTHTSFDDESSPAAVYRMALKYPSVNFVMYHMGLATDNLEAIDLISKVPNLYGDVSWVPKDKAVLAIEKCGYEKILFGTDNPINGLDTYDDDDFYNFYWNEAGALLGKDAFEHLMYKNAQKLFKLPSR